MSAQKIRDAINAGADVYVTATIAPGRTKRVSVKVLEVMRAAVRVRFEGGRESTIPFNEVEIEEKPKASLKPEPIVTTRRESPILPPPVRLEPPRVEMKPAPKPSTSVSSLSAWIEMGKEVEHEIATRIAELTQERRALDAEAKAIDARTGEVVAELRDLTAKKELLSQLGRQVTP